MGSRQKSPPKVIPETGFMMSRWNTITVLLVGLCLIGIFSTEITDTDFWWHLKTGEYITGHHTLPDPDPFAYTTADSPVRRFNLTHEWLSQVLMYLMYAAASFPGVIIARALLLTLLCGLAGLLAARSPQNFYAGLAAGCATASVAVAFTADRPAVVTFLGVAVFITLLEFRRWLWALPLIALVWANCHGGFFMGWIVLLAYAGESLITRRDRRPLWIITACSIGASLINPNGWRVVSTLLAYRSSAMTANLVEWQPPKLWGPPYGFAVLLGAAALVQILSWKRVRPAHAVLVVAFGAASLIAFRNILLIGFLAPVLISAYVPMRFPRIPHWTPTLLAAVVLATGVAQGRFFQLRTASWTVPSNAADFLVSRHITGPMFNTYEQGGYLIWKAWPQERVFIDGRSLSDSVYRDYGQILFNNDSAADAIAGPRAELLERYGIRAVVMNTMDFQSGALYPFALALASPASADWQLVYDDDQAVVFLRTPPPEIPVFPNKLGRVLRHLNQECETYIRNSPDTPLCARTLGNYWLRNQAAEPARRMLRLYLAHAEDEQARRALQRLEAGR